MRHRPSGCLSVCGGEARFYSFIISFRVSVIVGCIRDFCYDGLVFMRDFSRAIIRLIIGLSLLILGLSRNDLNTNLGID